MLMSNGIARLVTSAEDVLTVLGEKSTHTATAVASSSRKHPTDGLEPDVARVYEALPSRGMATVADLSRESALPAAQVIDGLAILELEQLVGRQDGGWRRRRTSNR